MGLGEAGPNTTDWSHGTEATADVTKVTHNFAMILFGVTCLVAALPGVHSQYSFFQQKLGEIDIKPILWGNMGDDRVGWGVTKDPSRSVIQPTQMVLTSAPRPPVTLWPCQMVRNPGIPQWLTLLTRHVPQVGGDFSLYPSNPGVRLHTKWSDIVLEAAANNEITLLLFNRCLAVS